MTKFVGVSKISQADQNFVLQSLCVNNVKLSRSLFVLSIVLTPEEYEFKIKRVCNIYAAVCGFNIYNDSAHIYGIQLRQKQWFHNTARHDYKARAVLSSSFIDELP